MKKTLAILVVAAAFGVNFAQAADGAHGGPGKGHGKGPGKPRGMHGPCEVYKKACHAAGFKLGQHKVGKGLWLDCVAKLVAGETVAGVTVEATADDATACKPVVDKAVAKAAAHAAKAESKEAAPAAGSAE